jgi:hypothetical protein
MTSKNIYEDRLEAFSFQEMLDALSGVGVETGRLELKREMIATHKIAHIACSIGNADGGIIAIGIQEPNADGALRVHATVDTSDRGKVAMLAGINARVYPPLPLDIQGYESADGSQSFLVLRVAYSTAAPHEYTGADESNNLPVRRGSTTGRLRLAEIDALRSRRSGVPVESPLGPKGFSQVDLTHEGVNPDFLFGMIIQPSAFASSRRVMDADDDRLCQEIGVETKGVNGTIHADFTLSRLIDGAWLHTPEKTQQDAIQGRIPRPDQQLLIESDGTITVRYIQTQGDLHAQLFATLATGYVAAQRAFTAFALGPLARVYLVQRLSASAREVGIAQGYEDRFGIDLATEPFADAFSSTIVRMFRAANRTSARDGVRNVLQQFIDTEIPLADVLQREWLA